MVESHGEGIAIDVLGRSREDLITLPARTTKGGIAWLVNLNPGAKIELL